MTISIEPAPILPLGRYLIHLLDGEWPFLGYCFHPSSGYQKEAIFLETIFKRCENRIFCMLYPILCFGIYVWKEKFWSRVKQICLICTPLYKLSQVTPGYLFYLYSYQDVMDRSKLSDIQLAGKNCYVVKSFYR